MTSSEQRRVFIENLIGLAAYENMTHETNAGDVKATETEVSEKPTSIVPPWEKRGTTPEVYYADTAKVLTEASTALANNNPKALIENSEAIARELSKVVEASGHFLIQREADKLKGIMSMIRKDIPNVEIHISEHAGTHPAGSGASSEDQSSEVRERINS